jgi:ubiquinone/menaquinone biosynthesis C-methylase UbiE
MTTPSWYPDELLYAGDEHLDAAYVRGYEAKAGVDAAAEVAALVRLGLGPDATLVDLGAGTGAVAIEAAKLCRRVVAVDVSPPMLAAARAAAGRAGAGNLEFVEAGLLSYDHTGEPADIVYSRNALHQLPDLWKAIALTRIHRTLRPDGMLRLRDLVFAVDDPADLGRVVEPWLDGAAPTADIGWTRAEYETHLRTEHSTFTWLLEPMLERAGFEILETEFSESRIYATYTCTRH